MSSKIPDIDDLLTYVTKYSRQGIIITDEHGITIWVNKTISDFTGYELEEFLGKTPGSVLQGEETDPRHVARLREGIGGRKLVETEILNYGKNGNKMWLDLYIFPIFDKDNNLTNFIGIQHDISKLKDKNEKLESFNHIVSHNLVNQINNIYNLSKLLNKSQDQVSKFAPKIDFASEKLMNTIEGLKTLLKFEKYGVRLKIEPVYLKSFVLDVVESVLFGENDVSIQIDSFCDKDLLICTNTAYLESVIHNLLTNSIKYQHPDRNLNIVIRLYQEKSNYFIIVRDNGLGMDLNKNGSNLFQIFQTFHDHKDSIGVGLYLCRKQVEELGGKISVTSEVNVGSEFTVQLPYVSEVM